jgi:hypothetical protein
MSAFKSASRTKKVPPGNAVHRRYHGGVGPQKRRKGFGCGVRLMRFERAQNKILWTECLWIIRRWHAYRLFGTVTHAKFQAVFLDGLQVRSARNHTDIVSPGSQPNGQVATDRASSKDAEFHSETSVPGCNLKSSSWI